MTFIGPDKEILFALNFNYFRTHSFKHVFECSKEPSRRDGFFEYPQHVLWMKNKENNFPIRNLIWRSAVTLIRLCN